MTRRKETLLTVEGRLESVRLSATLGRELRATRHRRRLTQRQVASRVGVAHVRVSDLERGRGAAAPLRLWVSLGIALGRPLAVGFSRDVREPAEPSDAGHLAAQEIVLQLARGHGRHANVELATKPWDPAHAADVVLRDDRTRTLLLIEIVNRAGDLGASFRSTDRKAAELERNTILAGGDAGAFRIAVGWLLVDTAANRAMVGRYPELFRSRFPGSSGMWAHALTEGTAPPRAPAVAWIDTRSGRIHPLRARA
jgi:transcriptional regulator with XRE-family HTH domain